MPVRIVIRICVVFYVAAIVTELLRTRRWKPFALQSLALIVLLAVDALITNAVLGFIAFGAGEFPTAVVVIMFVCVLLGIAARYLFYLKTPFSWAEMLKPLCISPILLLPLMGSVQTMKNLETMQVISFGLLAFQNGFFWQVVLERAQPRMRR